MVALFVFLSFLVAFYLSLIKEHSKIAYEIENATFDIKCKTIFLNQKFGNLSQEELQNLEQIDKLNCNFSSS